MNKEYPRILFISSHASLTGTRRLTYDFYLSFVKYGCQTDLMLKEEADIPEPHLFFISLKEKNRSNRKIKLFFNRFLLNIKKIVRLKLLHMKPKQNYYFFYKDENHPPFNPDRIVEKIEAKYDLVIINSWEGFIGAKVIEKIYDKLHVPIFLLPPDFCAITGGCHYFNDCVKYQSGCHSCPATNGDDFPAFNAQERKRIWTKTNLVLLGNDYTESIIHKSYVYGNKKVIKRFPVINEDLFKPRNIQNLRNEFDIDSSFKYIISFGAQSISDPRKGMIYLWEALNELYNIIGRDKRQEILLLIAGNASHLSKEKIPFPYKQLGYLNMEQLAKMYAVSNVFLSPSIIDAGPMMVNQALSCGTPVVSFAIGTALSVIMDKGTGYVAKTKNSVDFANGISTILELPNNEYEKMRQRCRNVALNTTSFKAAADPIIKAYRNLNLEIYKQ